MYGADGFQFIYVINCPKLYSQEVRLAINFNSADKELAKNGSIDA